MITLYFHPGFISLVPHIQLEEIGAYSAADASSLTLCRWAPGMPRAESNWPHIGPYIDRSLARPAVQRALQQEHLQEPWI